MNRYFFAAMVFIVGGIALGHRIGDGVLSIAIGIGVACTVVGLFDLYGRKRAGTSDSGGLGKKI